MWSVEQNLELIACTQMLLITTQADVSSGAKGIRLDLCL